MKTKSKQTENPGTDELAAVIALKIIAGQCKLAETLNAWVNRRAKRVQLRLLALLVAAVAGCLVICVSRPGGEAVIIGTAVKYPVSHIGLPSGIPRPKRTDSLTTNK